MTQPGAGVVLALAGPESGELEAVELEMQLRNLMGTVSRLVRERDLGAQVGDRQQSHGAEWGAGVRGQCWGLSVVLTSSDSVGIGSLMCRGFGGCLLTFAFPPAAG